MGFVKGGTPTAKSEQLYEQRFQEAEARRDGLDLSPEEREAHQRSVQLRAQQDMDAALAAAAATGEGVTATSQFTRHPEIPKAYVPLQYVTSKGEPIVIGGEEVLCQADLIVGMDSSNPTELTLVFVCPRCVQQGQKHEQDCQIRHAPVEQALRVRGRERASHLRAHGQDLPLRRHDRRERALPLPGLRLAGSHQRKQGVAGLMSRNEVHPGLWVGSHPETDPASDGIGLLVLCAFQHQQVPPTWSVSVHRAPLTDDAFQIMGGDTERAERAAAVVAHALRGGTSVLCTCREGLNRSGWVAALALVEMGMGREDAVKRVQVHRPGSLYNWFFQQHVLAKPY